MKLRDNDPFDRTECAVSKERVTLTISESAMNTTPTLIARIRRVVVTGLCLVGMLGLLVPDVHAQSSAFEEARSAYQSADYERAVQLFSEVAQDTEADKQLRKEALQYLGRVYIARSAMDEAREAVTRLLKLEPPLVELNPDVEPPPLMKLYYEVRKDLTGGYQVEREDPGLQTIAIMDFTNSSVDEKERFDPMQQGFASMLINYLNGSTDLKVVERERIQWLLQELEMQRDPGLVDQSTAVRTGKLLGATTALFGAFTVHDDDMWLSARLVKVETGEVLLAEQIIGDKDDFFELAQDLSMQVAQAVNVKLEESKLGAQTQTKSLDAMMSYSEGLSLLEQEQYRAAYEKFQEALEYDPNYTKAQLKADSIRPLIG